ncbi:FecR family protein [Pricia sp.]|uniref:FecR family protein n=1 Tax=Pricia sp. TaxID=2268138 RepID=UPI0035932A5E
MRYASYTEEDFITDEYFQKWILNPDPATQEFWGNWMAEHPEKKDLTENASRFIRMMDLGGGDELSDSEVDAMWQNIIHQKQKSTTESAGVRKLAYSKKKYKLWIAAACVGLIVSVLGFNQFWDSNTLEKATQLSGSEITLKLGDGTVQVLDENVTETITNSEGNKIVSQKKSLLIYDSKEGNEISYNELAVPYGKKFELMLSDGSHVFLNSGSKLRYPTGFKKRKQRTIFLDGEAYFSVAKDKESPLVVITEHMNTKVYGTEFNVSSYKNENNTSTVLLEGSVGVYRTDGDEPEKLHHVAPGERALIQNGKISVDRVNVKKYVAWTEGKLFFVDDRFELILKELERHFNIVIDNKIEGLNNKRFTGTFTEQTIEQIFRIFQEHTQFNYAIKENTITIYQKGS